jgi:hypothetical protein
MGHGYIGFLKALLLFPNKRSVIFFNPSLFHLKMPFPVYMNFHFYSFFCFFFHFSKSKVLQQAHARKILSNVKSTLAAAKKRCNDCQSYQEKLCHMTEKYNKCKDRMKSYEDYVKMANCVADKYKQKYKILKTKYKMLKEKSNLKENGELVFIGRNTIIPHR